MAEILIQRRRHRNIWPWLLGLLALALLPLPFLAADRDDGRSPRGSAASRRDATARRDTTSARDTTSPSDSAAAGAVVGPGTGGGAEGPRAAASPASAAAAAPRTTATAAGNVTPSAPPATLSTGSPRAATGVGTTGATATPGPAGTTTPPAGPRSTGGAAAAATTGASATATTFERLIAAGPPNASERGQREYTAEALHSLANELRALGASSAGIRAIVANADSLRMNGTRPNAHPDYARAAFLAAVREMDVLRGRYRARVDTGALRAAAWAVRPDQRFVAQRNIVQTFFQRARDAVHVLSRSGRTRRGSDVRAP